MVPLAPLRATPWIDTPDCPVKILVGLGGGELCFLSVRVPANDETWLSQALKGGAPRPLCGPVALCLPAPLSVSPGCQPSPTILIGLQVRMWFSAGNSEMLAHLKGNLTCRGPRANRALPERDGLSADGVRTAVACLRVLWHGSLRFRAVFCCVDRIK